MKPTAISNYECIIGIKKDIDWIKKTMYGVFLAICLNIIINLMGRI